MSRDKSTLFTAWDSRLKEHGSSLQDALLRPSLRIHVPTEAGGHNDRYYHIISRFALVVRDDGTPVASVPADTALLSLMKWAPEDAQILNTYLKSLGVSELKTLTRREIFIPMDADLSSPHYQQIYTDATGASWSICKDTQGRAVVMCGATEVGRYMTANAAEDDHNLPIAVVNLCDEVLA
jgi:hypothetical protein